MPAAESIDTLVRLDRRLLARLNPSDVIQEVLIAADQKLDRYLESSRRAMASG